jgi:hypothetical protein
MRSADLAVYADTLAARATMLAAELERVRARLRHAALEREARSALEGAVVARLEALGVLARIDLAAERAEIAELVGGLAALEELQAWVESQLFVAREEDLAMTE